MKRTRILFAALLLCVLALAFTSSSTTRTAEAQDPCVVCQGKVGALYNACADLYGETSYCGDIFNDGIVYCYATVCEL
jgi:hypothetical protein